MLVRRLANIFKGILTPKPRRGIEYPDWSFTGPLSLAFWDMLRSMDGDGRLDGLQIQKRK